MYCIRIYNILCTCIAHDAASRTHDAVYTICNITSSIFHKPGAEVVVQFAILQVPYFTSQVVVQFELFWKFRFRPGWTVHPVPLLRWCIQFTILQVPYFTCQGCCSTIWIILKILATICEHCTRVHSTTAVYAICNITSSIFHKPGCIHGIFWIMQIVYQTRRAENWVFWIMQIVYQTPARKTEYSEYSEYSGQQKRRRGINPFFSFPSCSPCYGWPSATAWAPLPSDTAFSASLFQHISGIPLPRQT